MSNKGNVGISFPFLIFTIFTILKLTNNIDWSWWWVTSPLWIPVAIAISIVFFLLIVAFIFVAFGLPIDEFKE
jgi:hypothetical protein